MKLIDKFAKIQKIGTHVDVPWSIYRILGPKRIYIIGDQIDLGVDTGDIEEVRNAVAYYVEQLGGKVEWGKL